MNPYLITLHALGETLSHAQVIFGYAVISIVSLVLLAFVASFAWITLKENQEKRKRARQVMEVEGKLRDLLLKAAEGKPAAVPGVWLAYRIVRDRPTKVDGDIADMLEQIARQG